MGVHFPVHPLLFLLASAKLHKYEREREQQRESNIRPLVVKDKADSTRPPSSPHPLRYFDTDCGREDCDEGTFDQVLHREGRSTSFLAIETMEVVAQDAIAVDIVVVEGTAEKLGCIFLFQGSFFLSKK